MECDGVGGLENYGNCAAQLEFACLKKDIRPRKTGLAFGGPSVRSGKANGGVSIWTAV